MRALTAEPLVTEALFTVSLVFSPGTSENHTYPTDSKMDPATLIQS